MENGPIKIEGGGLTATCATPEQAAALWRLLETQVNRAPAATSLADEPADERKRRTKPRTKPAAVAAEATNGHVANGGGAFRKSSNGGRQPSPLTLAVYDAIAKNPEPDLEQLAKANGVEVKAIRQVIWRGIGSGRLKKLAGGALKVV